MALTSTGQDVASNPSTSVGGGNMPADVFQPSTPTPNTGGGSMPGGLPTCIRFENVAELNEDVETAEGDDLLSVKVVALRVYFDKFAKNGQGAYKSYKIPFASGRLILTHRNGESSIFNFETADPRVQSVKEAEYLIPKNVYLEVVGRSSAVNGIFSSPTADDDIVPYQNRNLPYCTNK